MEKYSIDDLRQAFPDVDGIKLVLMELIINNKIESETLEMFDSNIEWIKQCYHKPNYTELKMNALNELLDGHGVESIIRESEWINKYWQDAIGLYVNMGDTYNQTIVFDTVSNEYQITSWGDFLEAFEMNKENNS